MNIEKILNEIYKIDSRITKYHKSIAKDVNRLMYLEKQLDEIIVKDKLYIPISNLNKYKGQSIDGITLIDSDGYYKTWDVGDIMEISEDGHFYFSDYERGLYYYDKNTERYYHHCNFVRNEGDNIVGFVDLKINNKVIGSKKSLLKKYVGETCSK